MGDEVDYLSADKHKSFVQADSVTLGVRSQTRTKCQNDKFAISLEYLKENVKDEVDFCQLINIERFFKVILSF